MSIKEQIATLPDDELWVTGRPTSPMFETTISGAELKTIVRSHTQLLALTALLDCRADDARNSGTGYTGH